MNSKSFAIAMSLTLILPMTGQARKIAHYYDNKLASELVSFPNCRALEEHVAQNINRNRVDILSGGVAYKGMSLNQMAKKSGERSESRALAGAAKSLAEAPSAADKVVGTNNQVEKVDEADFVKFNGRHIFQIYNGTLRILKAWPANEMNQLASMPVSGHPREIMVNETNAVVLANDGRGLTASIIDISQPASPRLLTEFKVPGYYKTARLIGDTLRIINQDHGSIQTYWREMPSPDGNGWLQDSQPKRTLSIQPTMQNVGSVQKTLDVVKDCSGVLVPKDVAPGVLTRIISIDLKAKKYQETLAFVRSDTVYASESAVYLASAGYESPMGLQKTAIHKFALKSGKTAEYEATGIVSGHLINQFAMDEHRGNLRVATNGTEYRSGDWNSFMQVSRIEVLAQKSKVLKSIGKSEDMGKGERLYSVRFDGDKGYVVTFRQVDPLYTVDLSDATNPRVIGELKVPGFSTYIHMLDDKHLLTIGQDADETTGRTRGLKLSVFDVRNFKKPREVKSLIFKSNVTSESSYEHKAFSFYREKGILAIPAQQAGIKSALLLFKVTTSDIKASGELSMSESTSYQSGVRRSFFADNFVYAIGHSSVRAASLDNPQTPISSVDFEQANLAESGW